ncbi:MULTISPECIES: hypothetical protein [unclassified Sphingomonas]|uniref:hypothetical protein n=1 Tax=unclassified Sphingomonas TaxID=196159 RepID=UPI002269C989|nr:MULTISPECIES: hypothetical protein [unclassified Sphingomonas]
MPWHEGRTFYFCDCGARDEHRDPEPPATLPCWNCKGGIMAQWVPPAVAAERAAEHSIAGPIGRLI